MLSVVFSIMSSRVNFKDCFCNGGTSESLSYPLLGVSILECGPSNEYSSCKLYPSEHFSSILVPWALPSLGTRLVNAKIYECMFGISNQVVYSIQMVDNTNVK